MQGIVYDSRTECAAERLLFALRDSAGVAQPAAQLARRLGVGEDEVALRAAELRALGYRVRDDGGSAYALDRGPPPLALPWEIVGRSGGRGGTDRPQSGAPSLASRAVFYGEADSTQERARSLAACEDGSANGLVVVAGTQTAGRGRMGRRWVSPPGGLWMSVVAEPGPPADTATLVPLAAALALRNAVSAAAGIEADLKWPNDLLVGGRKVAGILVDASAGDAGLMDSVIVGIGVNLAVDAVEIDAAAAGEPRGHAGAASLAARGGGAAAPDPALLARAFLAYLEVELEMLAHGRVDGAHGAARQWMTHSSMIGCEVEVECGGRTVSGTATGLDCDGALLVGRGTATERIVAGDVTAVRRARPSGA